MNIRRIVAPKHLDFRSEQVAEIAAFYNMLAKNVREVNIVDLRKTQSISEGCFVALKAQIEKNIDKLHSAKYLLTRPLGQNAFFFLKRHFGRIPKSNEYEIHIKTKLDKDTTVSEQTDTTIIDNVVSNLSAIGIYEYFEPIYDFFVELIGNATEHGIKEQNINWWLLHYKDHPDKSMHYVFVDMGKGIAGSHKEAGLPFKYLFLGDKYIVQDSFSGALISSTKQSNRGKGLPFIKDLVEKGIISDFQLITNRVCLEYVEGEFVYERIPNFDGTYYAWSINIENFNKWKSIVLTLPGTLA